MKKEKICLATVDDKAHVLAKEWGVTLELSEFCTAWNMDDRFDEAGPLVEEKLRYAPAKVLHAPFNELFPCAIDPKARELAKERYLQAIGLAKHYGAEKVVIHGGYNPWIYFPVWYTEQSVPFWKELVKEIPEGITLCLENVLEEEPGMLLDIVRNVDDPRIRMCLDIGHANAYSKVSVMEWLERCAPCISHFHIHNNDGSWDNHCPLNEGTIPMRELLERACDLCKDATFTLELTECEGSLRWMKEEGLL